MNVLAIDQGTSATKALVVAPGRPRARHRRGSRSVRRFLPDGGVEQDPEALWRSVVEAGRRRWTPRARPVGAVGLANQGETVLAWDRDRGTPLSPAISWQDRRATAVCERLAGEADRLQEITGLPLDPYFAAPKMRWLREHVTRDGVCTTTDAWLLHRLTGAFVTDAATASRTLLFDLGAGRWSLEACDAFDVDPGMLPEVIGNAEPIGETTAFGDRLPVTAAIVDQQAALFGEGCLTRGAAKCTYGTGAFLLANIGTDVRRSTAGLAACVAWKLGSATTYCLDGQVYTAGAAVAWLQRPGPARRARRPRSRRTGRRRRPLRARARRPGGAVLEAAGARRVRRAVAVDVARHARARGGRRHRRAGRVARPRHRVRSRGAARAPAGRRRSHALVDPHAGSGRSTAGADRRVSLGRRDRARRRGARAARRRRARAARPRRCHPWSRRGYLRAAHPPRTKPSARLRAWRSVVEATMDLVAL